MLVTLTNGILCKVQQALHKLQKLQNFIPFEFSASLISGVPDGQDPFWMEKGFVYGSKLLEDLTSLFFYCLGADKVTYTVLCKETLLPNASMLTEEYKVRGFSGGPVVKTVCTSNARGTGSKSGWRTRIPHAVRCDQKWLLFSRSVVFDSFRPRGLHHARLPCPCLSERAQIGVWVCVSGCACTTESLCFIAEINTTL